MKLTVVRGVPGSGKSTYAKKNYRCLILEQDMIHERNGQYAWSASRMKDAIEWCRGATEDMLSYGADVCVVNTFTKAAFVRQYEAIAREYSAQFEVVRMTGSYGNVHDVPAATLASMKSGFEDWPGEKLV